MANAFWVLTAFFNPGHYATRLQNYHRFRDHLYAQGGRLLTVELAFDNSPFQLQGGDAHRLVQVRSHSVMWQKERLLNIGLDHLPDDCDAIAWVDCDVLFTNPRWISETLQRLRDYPVVQPFEFVVRLARRGAPGNLATLPLGMAEGRRDPSFGFQVARGAHHQPMALKRWQRGSTGFAFCGRRAIFQQHRLYDKGVIGSGDDYIAAAFVQQPLVLPFPTEALRQDHQRWVRAVYPAIQGRLSYVPGALLHLWHGPLDLRFYNRRHRILARYAFDPATDLALNRDQCWEWHSPKRAMHQAVRHYFPLRHEDGAAWPLVRAVLQEPLLVCRALLGTCQARALGWLKRQAPTLYHAGQSVRDTVARWSLP